MNGKFNYYSKMSNISNDKKTIKNIFHWLGGISSVASMIASLLCITAENGHVRAAEGMVRTLKDHFESQIAAAKLSGLPLSGQQAAVPPLPPPPSIVNPRAGQLFHMGLDADRQAAANRGAARRDATLGLDARQGKPAPPPIPPRPQKTATQTQIAPPGVPPAAQRAIFPLTDDTLVGRQEAANRGAAARDATFAKAAQKQAISFPLTDATLAGRQEAANRGAAARDATFAREAARRQNAVSLQNSIAPVSASYHLSSLYPGVRFRKFLPHRLG